MLRKSSMKKRIFLLLGCLFLIVGIGAFFGRKYFGYAVALSKKPFVELLKTKEDSLLSLKLQENYPFLRDSIELKRQAFSKEYSSKLTETGKKKVLQEAGVYL